MTRPLQRRERAKAFIRSVFPAGARIFDRLRAPHPSKIDPAHQIEAVFTDIYLNNSWANRESVSGRGSTLARTGVIRGMLPALLESVGAKSLFDAACGDLNWMRHVDLRNVEYIGADVVPALIARNNRKFGRKGRSFVALDITCDQIPRADVILCRDCFIHLPNASIHSAVRNFRKSGSTFLLATTHVGIKENIDIRAGEWRSVNLQLPPFDFPEPVRLLCEDSDQGKYLGMWDLNSQVEST